MFLKIGHRGARAYEIENTLESFTRAIELGANAVELDVRISKDDQLIVSHDENLKRVFGKDMRINEATLRELKHATEDRILTLRLAALFIITGYLDDYTEFLKESVKYLEEYAKPHGFSIEMIETAENIMKDCLKEKPATLEGRILNDAMFDYYGRTDFIERTELLFREASDNLTRIDKNLWYKNEINNVSRHKFKTKTANLLRSKSVEEQVQDLNQYLSE